jgi:hypothetical protein
VVAEANANIDGAMQGPLATLVQSADQVTRHSRGASGAPGRRVVLAWYAGPHDLEIVIRRGPHVIDAVAELG